MLSLRLILVCIVFREIYGREQVEWGSDSISRERKFIGDNRAFRSIPISRSRRQVVGPPPPSSYFSGRNSGSGDTKPFIPKIEPPKPGSILTYDGKAISTNIGAFSIVPKSERRTPSINQRRPQYATFRGELPPPIPDIVPRDLPQFKDNRGVIPNLPSRFE